MDNPTMILLRGGRVMDPATGFDATADVLIGAGRVREIGQSLSPPPGCRVVAAAGLVVAPGLVDMHVHLREPGFEYKETIAGGLSAAAAGGVTSVAAMPNTAPTVDDPSVVGFVLDKAQLAGKSRLYPIGAITKGLKGQALTEMGLLLRAGCVAFSDDGKAVGDSGVMRRALEYCRGFNGLIIQHAEDHGLSVHGCMHEGAISARLGLPGIPAAAEEVMVDRDIRLVAITGGRYHVAHLSTQGAMMAVAQAKKAGLPVSCEVTPHHLVLTDGAVTCYDANAKMSPPLRSTEDLNALKKGLAQGIIDTIATDHAPHDLDSKQVEFCRASNGVVGLETLLPIALELVADGVLSLADCLAKMTINPARLLGIPRGRLAVGEGADVVLFDPTESWIVEADRFQGKGRNTCFQGRPVKGRVKMTIVEGRVVYQDGVL